jgi:hypothetical protein
VDTLERLEVECPLGVRANLQILDLQPDLIQYRPGARAGSALPYQGPLLLYHNLGVGAGQLLDVSTLGFGQPMGEPGDLGQLGGFLVDRVSGLREALPHRDDHEAQHHGVDGACNIVVLLTPRRWHQALHQHQPRNRNQHGQTDHE